MMKFAFPILSLLLSANALKQGILEKAAELAVEKAAERVAEQAVEKELEAGSTNSSPEYSEEYFEDRGNFGIKDPVIEKKKNVESEEDEDEIWKAFTDWEKTFRKVQWSKEDFGWDDPETEIEPKSPRKRSFDTVKLENPKDC